MKKHWRMFYVKNNGEGSVHDLGVMDDRATESLAFNIAHYNYNDAIEKRERLNCWRIYWCRRR